MNRVTPAYRRWYDRQPERMAAHAARVMAAYHALSPEERFVKISNGKLRRRGLTAALTVAELPSMADGCAYCGGAAETWDHVVPLSRGGPHCGDNLVPVCGKCNKRKSARTPDEWLAAGLYGGRPLAKAA